MASDNKREPLNDLAESISQALMAGVKVREIKELVDAVEKTTRVIQRVIQEG